MTRQFCSLLMLFIQVLLIAIKSIVLHFIPKSYNRCQKNVGGQLVLITGAGGGIGRQLALGFARLGCKVVCWDVAKQANEETVALVKSTGGEAYGYHVDLTDKEDVYRKAELVKNECGSVTILVNNAGLAGIPGRILDTADEDIQRVFQVNILSHFWTVKAFLQGMIDAKQGHVITISSLLGLFGSAQALAYSSTKFAACGLHDSLRKQFLVYGYNFIKTTVVCPYYVRTPLVQPFKLEENGITQLEPDDVAQRIIDAFLRDQEFLVLQPKLVAIAAFLRSMLPSAAVDLILKSASAGTVVKQTVDKSR